MAGEALARRVLAVLGSVRLRTTVAAMAVVGLALAVGAAGMMATLQGRLLDEVEAGAERRAEEVAADLERGRSPDLSVTDDDEEFVQILAGASVEAASGNLRAGSPVAAAGGVDGRQVDVDVDDDRERFVVAVESVEGDGRDRRVLVGRSVEDVSDAVSAVWSLLRLGLPMLVALVGVTTWWVVGRAFRPVARIRREVEEITAAEIHRRVPVPPAHDEIGRLAETMNHMLARLDGAQQRQRRFVADASHELRSPVSSLRQHAEVARTYGQDGEARELADVVLAESTRMARLIDDLLLLARSDEGSAGQRVQPVDVDDLVFEEVDRLRRETELHVDVRSVGAARVLGRPLELRRVLRNLGDNAARHAGATIRFSLGTHGGEVVLGVDDDGPGIPPEDRARVLERFVRLDESRARDAGGAGLGLAIVQTVVTSHGGSLVITESGLGGARVEVRLPEAPAA